MSRIIFLRRRALGLGSVRGMTEFIDNPDTEGPIVKQKAGGYIGQKAGYVRNDHLERMPEFDENDWLVRWGCTSRTEKFKLERQLNPSKAIGQVNDKRGFRAKCQAEMPAYTPNSFFNLHETPDDFGGDYILRPKTHSQGRKLWVVNNKVDLFKRLQAEKLDFDNGWYASKMIDKVAEYRVYVVEGRVVSVARKIPEDENAVAWNVAQGGEFEVLRWDGWAEIPSALTCAVKAMALTDLDFGGVDVMMDANGLSYIIEINSAPSLPLLDDGSVSYRQKCMAKAFNWIAEHGKGNVKPINPGDVGWRDFIHPAIWRPKAERKLAA